jgi:t-SNARE complex subunit (syntaxin)
VYDRGESIKEVSSQIEGLNSILRKMGDLVAMQGDLLNRIDENLTMGVTNVKAGREQLE